MPILSSNRGHIGSSDAPLTSHLLIWLPEDEERVRTIVVRVLGTVVWTSIIHKADGPPESLGKDGKSIWEHYNEMAVVEDNIREVEWKDLADTILVFVCLSTPYDALLLMWLQDGMIFCSGWANPSLLSLLTYYTDFLSSNPLE